MRRKQPVGQCSGIRPGLAGLTRLTGSVRALRIDVLSGGDVTPSDQNAGQPAPGGAVCAVAHRYERDWPRLATSSLIVGSNPENGFFWSPVMAVSGQISVAISAVAGTLAVVPAARYRTPGW